MIKMQKLFTYLLILVSSAAINGNNDAAAPSAQHDGYQSANDAERGIELAIPSHPQYESAGANPSLLFREQCFI